MTVAFPVAKRVHLATALDKTQAFDLRRCATGMKKHEILSPQSRAALFDPPTDPAAIVRHYTFSPEDLALIRKRRRTANRLGFAVQLAYFRHPGRIMRVDEEPLENMLTFIARQVDARAEDLRDYASRAQTRREHLADLQACLNVRFARRADARPLFSVALNEAIGTDRGDTIVSAMIEHLRVSCVLLPSPLELERLALTARALARKRAYKNLVEDLSTETVAGLEAMLVVAVDDDRTPLAWLREWPEAPRQRNLVALVERLQAVRKLGVGSDREKRIHRARYAAIAREISVLVPRDIWRFDAPRRLATLVVFAREMEAPIRTTWSIEPRRSTHRREPCSAWPRPCSQPRRRTKTRLPPSSGRSAGNA